MIEGIALWLAKLGPRFHRAFIEGNRWRLYLKGLGATVEMTALALCMGIALGVVVAVIRTAHDQQRPGRHNLLLGLLNVIFKTSRNMIAVGIIGLGINSGAYVAEIVRGGLMSVDVGQSEAGRSLGLNYFDTMRFIVIPQAFKNILPSLGNEFITLFKDTSLVQAIGGAELAYYASTIGGNTFDFMPPYIGIAVMYLVIVIGLTWVQGKLERRLRQSDRR